VEWFKWQSASLPSMRPLVQTSVPKEKLKVYAKMVSELITYKEETQELSTI
jgi:hypothetical protein